MLIDIELIDFCQFGFARLGLKDAGLTWIGGDNRDSESADNNGSGKSNLFKAIGWCLYGETIDGKKGDEVIREGTKCATAKCLWRDGEVEWVIQRERRKGAPKLRMFRDGEEVKGSKADFQQQIVDMVGMDWHAFRNTVLYGQRDTSRFIHPDTSDKDRKEMLHRVLRTGILKDCHEWVKEQNLTLKRAEASMVTEIETRQARIEEHDLDGLREQRDTWDDLIRRELRALRKDARECRDKAREAAEEAGSIDGFKTRLNNARAERAACEKASDDADAVDKQYEDLSDEYNEVRRDIAKHEAERDSLGRHLEQLDGSTCPVCSSDLKSGKAESHTKAIALKWDSLVPVIEGAEARRDELQGEMEMLRERASDLRAIARGITDASRKVDRAIEALHEAESATTRAEGYVKMAKAKLAEIESRKASVNPYMEMVDSAEAKVAKLAEEIGARQAEASKLATKRAHYEFWVRGFSGAGLPSFVMDAVMPYLTERTNHYLDTLSDGEITVNFSTQRELKSAKGEFRDEIDISWEIEGVSGYPPSGGQWKKMELASDLALMDLVASREGATIDLLCLDEALDGLDAAGRQRIIHLLHDLRSQRGSIFVISHDPDVAEVFEKSVVVVKEDGVARLE